LKRDVRDEERRAQALANFDAKKLRMIPGTSWYFELEFSGMTTDERPDDKLDLPKPPRKIPEGPPQQTFQIFCYIREGPGTPNHGGENSRYAEEFIGQPTAKQIEE
jgi:hypothetical protein